MNHYTFIGKNIVRSDAVDKVTGDGVFVADIKLPHMLSIAIVRSEKYAHANILKIDYEAAIIDGVRAIVTGKGAYVAQTQSFQENKQKYMLGCCIADQEPMAREKVRYIGEPVVAVIADRIEVAKKAATKITIEYEELPYCITQDEALQSEAPIIHKDLASYYKNSACNPIADTNIFQYYKLLKGDSTKVFEENKHLVFEEEFSYPHISHAQMEPHGVIAQWERSGEVTIYTSSQSPFCIREVIAESFGLTYSKVKVIVPYIGGGFGGKSDFTIEPLITYIASFVPGFPVRYILSREEMFFGSLLGRGAVGKVKTAITKEGKIKALEVDLRFQGGAYGDCSLNIVKAAGHNSSGPYEIDHIKSESKGVYTNTPYVGAFRGYGHPEVHWMMDRNLDIIAAKLGMDPYKLKLKNLLRPGSKNAINQTFEEHFGKLEECVNYVYNALTSYEFKGKDKLFGYGITPIMKSPVMPTNAASSATIRFNEDASVSVSISGIDMGQGLTTSLSQITAEALKIPIEKVRVCRTVRTEYTPYEWQSVASRGTWTIGNSIIRAAKVAISQMIFLASQVLEIPANDLEYDGEKVFCKKDFSKFVPIEKLIMGYVAKDGSASGGPINAYGYYIPPGLTFPDPKTGQGNLASEWTFGCQGIIVEIDPQSAQIDVKKMITAIDAGKIINPVLARGQVVGAMIQALGAATNETIMYNEIGKIQNASFMDYKIPTPEDLENIEIDVKFFETPFDKGPFGAKCLAEHGTVGVAPALGNAIFKATGINFFELPMTSDRLLQKLIEKRSK